MSASGASSPARGEERSIPSFIGRTGLAWALVVAFSIGSFLLAIAVRPHGGAPMSLDESWARTVVDTRISPLTEAAKGLNVLGLTAASWSIRGVLALWLCLGRRRWACLAFALTWAGAALASPLVKLVVDRPRPPASQALVGAGSASFPSGHVLAMASTTLVLVLVLVPPGRRSWWLAAVAFATLAMAWSRTYLGVHWLTDTVAGALLGWALALTATLATQSLREHRVRAPRAFAPPP